jgi:hypothetical protein
VLSPVGMKHGTRVRIVACANGTCGTRACSCPIKDRDLVLTYKGYEYLDHKIVYNEAMYATDKVVRLNSEKFNKHKERLINE